MYRLHDAPEPVDERAACEGLAPEILIPPKLEEHRNFSCHRVSVLRRHLDQPEHLVSTQPDPKLAGIGLVLPERRLEPVTRLGVHAAHQEPELVVE
jgi:hypothetical protein